MEKSLSQTETLVRNVTCGMDRIKNRVKDGRQRRGIASLKVSETFKNHEQNMEELCDTKPLNYGIAEGRTPQ